MYMSSASAVFQTSVVRLDRYLRAWAWTPSTHISIYSMHTPSFCADCRAQMGVCFLAHLFMSSCSSIATSQFLHFCLPPVFLTMHTSGGSVSPEPFCLHVFCSVLGPSKQCSESPNVYNQKRLFLHKKLFEVTFPISTNRDIFSYCRKSKRITL